jgi:hypothetical protein
MGRPDLKLVPSFYHKYIDQIIEEDLDAALYNNSSELFQLLETIEDDRWNYRYAEINGASKK